MALTREQFLTACDIRSEVVAVPEMGEGATVIVRGVSARDWMKLREAVKADPDHAYVHYLVATVVDDQGKPLFTPADAEALADKSIAVIDRLSAAAQRVNEGGGTASKN